MLVADRRVAPFLYQETEVVSPASIAVYRAQADPASATPVASIALELPGLVKIHGMLTLEGTADAPPLLVVIATEDNHFYRGMLDFWNPWSHSDVLLHVLVFDVSDPQEPQQLMKWRFQGSLLAVRRVGRA